MFFNSEKITVFVFLNTWDLIYEDNSVLADISKIINLIYLNHSVVDNHSKVVLSFLSRSVKNKHVVYGNPVVDN